MPQMINHQISLQQIQDFERDGVICLKGVLDDIWIEKLRTAVNRNTLNSVGVRGSKRLNSNVVHDYGLWLKDADFHALIFKSPLANIAVQILKSQKLNFLSDGFFVKKPTADSRVEWHNDQPYWPVQGGKCCKIWLTLDAVTQENGRLEYVKGSHLWNQELTENSDNSWFSPPHAQELLSWNMEPGDCLVHHFLTIHHSVTNTSSTLRRAIVTNWAGDDVVYYSRPKAWPYIPIEEIDIPEFKSLKNLKVGEPIDCDIFPIIPLNS
ncbi:MULTISPECIES: phytanoyl-CoA dioxygenase family protein [unclassified Anabaena]|uniref:phytanoyl-CoA dioxygenase family protein n=1 Tax=unclassified Anabaena TaxID=2619674 RepID=UPI000834DB53|nr:MULTISPECIES: phytanoyl-CoA dioxygenase family protein [unclassified Anabaena]